MQLVELLGQPQLVTLFKRLLERKRLPQGILLEGKPGTGRRSLAMALAQAHLCENLNVGEHKGDSCGHCESCKLIKVAAHPDCVGLPHDTELADIPVARVRDEIVSRAQDSALMGRGRIFFLPSVERLRPDACNALLKVLEEPAPGCVFIMTCAQRQAVLATIRSRSQCYRLNDLSASVITEILKTQGCDHAQAEHLALHAGGSHRGLVTAESNSEPAPLAELQSLLTKGYDAEIISSLCDQLPQQVPVSISLSLPAYRRLICKQWLDQLLQIVRQRLRRDNSIECINWIKCILRQQHDVAVNIDPRFVLEGLPIV